MLDEYIECYLQLLRDNYVCSNIKIFDQTSGTYSYNLISEWLNIKDKKGFPFDNNTLFLEYEGAIKNSNSNSIKKLNQDD